jgi:hypothetical protein
MALIIEDGTVVVGAESYCTEAFADIYHENRANSDWNLVIDKEAALRKATDYMIQAYRSSWSGYRADSTQNLDWPRTNVYLNDFAEEVSIASNIVPVEVQNACAELALKTYSETLLVEDITQKVTQEIIGPITVKYSDTSTQSYKYYTAVNSMLKSYLKPSSRGVIR